MSIRDYYQRIAAGVPRLVADQPRKKDVVFCDIETYPNLFYVAFKRARDGKRIGFEFSHRSALDVVKLRRVMKNNTIVTFNGKSYDVPMIYLALTGASNEELKLANDKIIKGGIKWWDVESAIGCTIPKKLDHIDLIEPNPAVMQGLKILNGRLHGKRLQDLPYSPDTNLTDKQMDDVIDYCLVSDLDATENLWNALQEPMRLREDLGKEFGVDFRSKSDAQFGEYIIKHRIQKKTGQRPKKPKVRPGSTFKYEVPSFIKFESDRLNELLDSIRDTNFFIKKDGKTEKPKHLDVELPIGASVYSFGIGGLHSTEANRSSHSDDDSIMIDADVASQYPRAISKLGLYPKSVGPIFNVVYDEIIDDRVKAKRAKDKVRDKGLKIALNGGGYGKLGSQYSVLYAPHLLLAVTLTCQLSVLMLVERAEAAGIPVISGNTDGVIFKCPRHLFDGFVMKDGKPTDRLMPSVLSEITDQWERETGFTLEFTEYRSIYNQSVNSYFAVKPDNTVKRKGPNGNPWSKRPGESDLREQMSKNPQMTICSEAVVERILNGTPVADTIHASDDIREFVTVVNVKGGGVWSGDLITKETGTEGAEYLGKVVRYAWCRDGAPIYYREPHPTTGNFKKVSKTDGCRPLMDLPDEMPADLDRDRYIAEANKILEEIGFFDTATPAPAASAFYASLLREAA